MDLRSQARYRRWAYGFAPYVFNQEIYKDTAIYYSDLETGEPRGFAPGRGGAWRRRWRRRRRPVLDEPVAAGHLHSGGTEAPDETAQGDVAESRHEAGIFVSHGAREYLRDGRYTVERIEEDGPRDAMSITLCESGQCVRQWRGPQRRELR